MDLVFSYLINLFAVFGLVAVIALVLSPFVLKYYFRPKQDDAFDEFYASTLINYRDNLECLRDLTITENGDYSDIFHFYESCFNFFKYRYPSSKRLQAVKESRDKYDNVSPRGRVDILGAFVVMNALLEEDIATMRQIAKN